MKSIRKTRIASNENCAAYLRISGLLYVVTNPREEATQRLDGLLATGGGCGGGLRRRSSAHSAHARASRNHLSFPPWFAAGWLSGASVPSAAGASRLLTLALPNWDVLQSDRGRVRPGFANHGHVPLRHHRRSSCRPRLIPGRVPQRRSRHLAAGKGPPAAPPHGHRGGVVRWGRLLRQVPGLRRGRGRGGAPARWQRLPHRCDCWAFQAPAGPRGSGGRELAK